MDYHHLLWPGVPNHSLMVSKMATETYRMRHKRKHPELSDQKIWLRETTMPTSHYIAFIFYTMNFKYRNIADRGHACNSFQSLMSLLALSLGGFDIDTIPFGSLDNGIVTMKVDVHGYVDAAGFWTQEFYHRFARGAWTRDQTDGNKHWVTQVHGLGRISLAQLLCFAIDPQHSRDLQGRLQGELCNMFTQIAFILDNSISVLARDVSTLKIDSQSKNKQRMAADANVIFLEKVANLLWTGEDTWHHHNNTNLEFIIFSVLIFLITWLEDKHT